MFCETNQLVLSLKYQTNRRRCTVWGLFLKPELSTNKLQQRQLIRNMKPNQTAFL